MNKILLTGGLGFIGTNLIHKLLKLKYKVLNLDKNGEHSNSCYLKKEKKYSFKRIDLANADQKIINKIFSSFKPNIIINMAAESHVDRSIDNPIKFANDNIFLTIKLLIATVKYKKQKNSVRFIHIGTDEIYGDILLNSKERFTESSKISPNNPYSASKASCHHFVKSFIKTYKLKCIIINPSNNYGKFQLPEKMIPKSILKIINNKPVEVYGNGLNMRNWIHVSDTVGGILKILKKGKNNEIYNLASDDCISNNQVIKFLREITKKLLNKNINIKYVKDRPGHDLKYLLENKKIKKLGWRQKMNLKKGLIETFEWYLNKKNLKYFKNIKSYQKRVGNRLV